MTNWSTSEQAPNRPALLPIDYLLEIIAALTLLVLLALPVLYFELLPNQIPTHYGANGLPNAFGSKTSLWLLPGLGLLLYGFMTFINRRPERFNYSVKITPENAETQYVMATRLLRVIKVIVLGVFTFLVWRTINIAQNEAQGLGYWVLPIVLSATLGTTFFYLFRSVARK